MADLVRRTYQKNSEIDPERGATDPGGPRRRSLWALGGRQAAGYLLLVVLPVVGVFVVLRLSGTLRSEGGPLTGPGAGHPALLGSLLLSVALIVMLTRAAGTVAARWGQPQVIGEMAAGLLLGPTVLGSLAPSVHAWLFPPAVVPLLDTLGQLGVIFFMFLVGLELPLDLLRRSTRAVLTIGHASTALPFLCGILLALTVLEPYRPRGIGELPFMLFCGLSLSVTAFPVLASILSERGIHRTALGTLGLTTAGVIDVTAWCLLTVVISEVRGGSSSIVMLRTVVFTALFVAFMVFVVRPALARFLRRDDEAGRVWILSAVALLAVVLLSAWATDSLGIHAIFGAFLAGVVMPRSSATVHRVADRLEGLTYWMLLPLFFAVVGLKTSLGGVGGLSFWMIALVLTAVAMASKVLSTAAAGRLNGLPGRQAWSLGVMMNCRGLTELVVLDVGLSLGVIGPDLFGLFVLMALVTTSLTGPLLNLLGTASLVTPARKERQT